MKVITISQKDLFFANVQDFNRRSQVSIIIDYILADEIIDEVFILRGLPRTGKSTILKHVLLDLPIDIAAKTALIIMNRTDHWDDLENKLDELYKNGIVNVLIDEITYLKSYILSCSSLSNVYVSCYGMKIVISGSNSLALLFSKQEGLARKSFDFSVTTIHFVEWKNLVKLTNNKDITIEDYIEYGGLLDNLKNVSSHVFRIKKLIWQ